MSDYKPNSALRGKTILNTRTSHQARALYDLITSYGAIALAFPCIAIQPPEDTALLDNALKQLIAGEFDWLVLTSQNTILSISERLTALRIDLPVQHDFKIAVVGSSTEEALTHYLSLKADVVPDTFIAESLARAIPDLQGKRILLPESAIARPTLANQLRAAGADVHAITAYETICTNNDLNIEKCLQSGEIDAITFTSSSTVDCFCMHLTTETDETSELLTNVVIACIGTKTAETAEKHGLAVDVIPEEFTLAGMMNALETYFATQDDSK